MPVSNTELTMMFEHVLRHSKVDATPIPVVTAGRVVAPAESVPS